MDDDEQCYSATIEQLVEMYCSVYADDTGRSIDSFVGRESIKDILCVSSGLSFNENCTIRIIQDKVAVVGDAWCDDARSAKLIPYIRANFDVDEGDEIVLK
jgi:hypothetical protein